MEDALRVCGIVHLDRHVKTLRFLVVLGRAVRRHQQRVAYLQPGMEDQVVCFRWHLARDRRIPMGLHFELAAEHLLVEPERFRALAVEVEIGSELHGRVSF